MTRTDYVRGLNRRLRSDGLQLIRIHSDDPRWTAYGDYVLRDRRGVQQPVSLFDFAPTDLVWGLAKRKMPGPLESMKQRIAHIERRKAG